MLKFLNNSQFKGLYIRIEEKMNLTCSLSNDDLKVDTIITYTCHKKQVELVSLRSFLQAFKTETLESLCYKIYHELKKHVRKLCVTVIGETVNHPKCQVQLK